jgi:transcriptional regulator with XRE-family HTH domain
MLKQSIVLVNYFFTKFWIFFPENVYMDYSGSAILGRIDERLKMMNQGREAIKSALGIGESTVSAWRKSRPRIDDIYRIAKYLDVDLEWLVSGEDVVGLELDERDLLDSYRRLDADDRLDVVGLIAVKLQRYPQRGASRLGAAG